MPRKQKLSPEEKVKIIQEYLKGNIGLCQAAQRSGVWAKTMKHWVRNYEADGVEAFLPHKNRVYSPELKRQAVESYLCGSGSEWDICKRYHIRDRRQLRA